LWDKETLFFKSKPGKLLILSDRLKKKPESWQNKPETKLAILLKTLDGSRNKPETNPRTNPSKPSLSEDLVPPFSSLSPNPFGEMHGPPVAQANLKRQI
jgi:hypothetical protein